MTVELTDGRRMRRWSQMKRRLSLTQARARRFVITLRVKPNKRGKKMSRSFVSIDRTLLPRWEEQCFEVAIVGSPR